MAEIHEILTELVDKVADIDIDGYYNYLVKAAIANATDQIDQQQRERVEKMEEALQRIADGEIPDPETYCQDLDLSEAVSGHFMGIAKAALKELERNS